MTIPADFPREPVIAGLTGVQPKVAARLDAASGRYVTAPTAEHIQERYEICEDIAAQLVAKCRAKRTGKYAHLSESQILERLLAQLLGTAWGSPEEMKWVIRSTAAQLGWEIPSGAGVLSVMLGDSA